MNDILKNELRFNFVILENLFLNVNKRTCSPFK